MSEQPPPYAGPSHPPPGHAPPSQAPPRDPVPHVVSLGPTPPPPRRRTGLVIGLAVALAAALLTASALLPRWLQEPPPDLSEVVAYDGLGMGHTPGDVDYPQSPPVGGEHAPAWLECGVYATPVLEELAVHDLEHGTVWIAYDPGLDEDEVEQLAEQLPRNGIMAPYPGLDAPAVVTVWGRQLRLDGADDARLELFVAQFGHGETAPEPNASCAGGVGCDGPGDEPGTSA